MPNESDRYRIEEAVAKHGTKPSNGKVLVFLPTHGTFLRYAGTYFTMNYRAGHEIYQCPAVLFADATPFRLDPRCVVVDDGNLAMFWFPRANIKQVDPVLREWFDRNPN